MTSRILEWSLQVANDGAYQSGSLPKKGQPSISGQHWLPHVDYLIREDECIFGIYRLNTKVGVIPDLTFWFPDLYPRTVHPRISSVLHQELYIFFPRPPPWFIRSRTRIIIEKSQLPPSCLSISFNSTVRLSQAICLRWVEPVHLPPSAATEVDDIVPI